jgi:uncharacterized protein with PIN domain
MKSLDYFLYIAIGLIFYVLILILLRSLNVWKKTECNNCNNCCPDCSKPLERIKRLKKDYVVNYLTFKLFDFKRYKCMNCAWEGRRWERPFSGKF